MKFLLNRKPVEGPWGGGNHFLKGFIEEANRRGHEIVFGVEMGIDAIYLHDQRPDELGVSINEAIQYKTYFPGTLVIHRVNECDDRKGTVGVDDMLRETSKYTDFTIFVSNWMKEYHVNKGWNCNSTTVFLNGVKKNHFFPREKINNGKTNIVTHHWSNNDLKGFDIYNEIDEWVSSNPDFTFTYIGREQGGFKNTKVIPPLFGKDLGEELGKYDVYISASRHDPGPNHVLESLACEIPTYARVDGGGSVEFAGQDHTFSSMQDLEAILLNKQYKKNTMCPEDWSDRMKLLFDQLELKIEHEKNKNSLF